MYRVCWRASAAVDRRRSTKTQYHHHDCRDHAHQFVQARGVAVRAPTRRRYAAAPCDLVTPPRRRPTTSGSGVTEDSFRRSSTSAPRRNITTSPSSSSPRRRSCGHYRRRSSRRRRWSKRATVVQAGQYCVVLFSVCCSRSTMSPWWPAPRNGRRWQRRQRRQRSGLWQCVGCTVCWWSLLLCPTSRKVSRLFTVFHFDYQERRSWGLWEVLDPLKICKTGHSIYFDPTPKNVTFFHPNLLLDNSASFKSSMMKDLCQKWKVKLIFRGAYRLPGTGIVECLEIVDVGRNLKQFDGLTWLTLTPYFTTDLRHCWLQIYGTGLYLSNFNSRGRSF